MKLIKPLLLVALTSLSLAACARYNGEDRGKPMLPNQVNAKWQAECSGCHMAYPPGLLPAASWKKVMSGLDKHFGTDASLSAADTAEITNFLVQNPSNRWSSTAAPLRTTEGEWFRVKHGEISAAVFARASIKSKSNCIACHSGAASGNFDDRTIPK
ncbi:MAG: cytochrome C [Comamonadaceae bacterium CG2_30_57_122]|nr:MAG: cytochrome C [Comamonadaceae bacterium CG2_30_57_122]